MRIAERTPTRLMLVYEPQAAAFRWALLIFSGFVIAAVLIASPFSGAIFFVLAGLGVAAAIVATMARRVTLTLDAANQSATLMRDNAPVFGPLFTAERRFSLSDGLRFSAWPFGKQRNFYNVTYGLFLITDPDNGTGERLAVYDDVVTANDVAKTLNHWLDQARLGQAEES